MSFGTTKLSQPRLWEGCMGGATLHTAAPSSTIPTSPSATPAAPSSSTLTMDVSTVASSQQALREVLRSAAQFDTASRAWAAYHQSGHRAVVGYAWNDFQTSAAQHVVSLRGLRVFKQAVQKELIWLEKHAATTGSDDAPCPSSNAMYMCTVWQRAMRAAVDHAPITELDAAFALSPPAPTIAQPTSRPKPIKVDIVCQAGRRWIRIVTMKPIGLLSEFRGAESEMTPDDSDDDTDDEDHAEGQAQTETVADMRAKLAKDELDGAAERSSLVRMMRDLTQAAQLHEQNTSWGRPAIDIVLTRMSFDVDKSDLAHKFYDKDESSRYEARLRAIRQEAVRLGVNLVVSDAQLAGLAEAAAFPAIPMPPARDVPAPTRTIHLDLSALIAFVSYISHMPLPARAEDADERFAKVHWRREEADLPRDDPDGDDGDADEEGGDETRAADQEDRGQHARALVEQLRREMTEDCFFDVILRLVDGGPVRFTCTSEARDKMMDIVNIVGGTSEKRRATVLFDTAGAAADLWKGSRWAADEERERAVRARIVLPVEVLSDERIAVEAAAAAHSPASPSFEPSFCAQASQALQHGLRSFHPDTRPPKGQQAVLRQTRHTLASMLYGLQLRQTTLTTNISSVKWLVREMYRTEARHGIVPAYCAANDNDNDVASPFSAALWVMYPRSLAERMAVKGEEDEMSSHDVAGSVRGYDLSTSFDDVSPETHASTIAADTSYGRTIWLKLDGTQSTAAAPHTPTPWATSKESSGSDPFVASLSAGSRQQSDEHSHRGAGGKLLRNVRVFFAGPRPRARLSIKHFRWWPLGGVEKAWLKWTSPVAWKDASPCPAVGGNDVERGPEAQRRLQSFEERDEDPWWAGVRHDVRRNALHWTLLTLTLIGWVLGFSFLSKALWYDGSVVATDGTRSDTIFFGCTTTFWTANSGCGLDGTLCSPFTGTLPYDFRCPANCQQTTLGGPRAVGDELPAYVPLVVGGSNASTSIDAYASSSYVYRGDSFVCSAAIHAGILAREYGGCGRLWLNGAFSGYEGVERNGITSTSFNSTFPLSYSFDESVRSQSCQDRRERGYILDVILLAFVGFVLRPKRIVYFFLLVCVGFWHINFLSYPRQYPMSVGLAMGDFLPTLFVAYGLWRVNFRYVLPAFTHIPLESNVGIQGLYWIGVMMNLVFVNVPLSRLVASDITSQPGALTSLIVIIVVVVVLAVNQVRVIRKVGMLPKYLTLAIVGGIIVGLLAAVPTTGLRLHHYIIAMVLLPFCAFETRLSLLYSAFLLGVFLNGVGRWGYDGLIEDVDAIRGSGTSGSSLPAFVGASNWTGVAPFNTSTDIATLVNGNLTALVANSTGIVNWQPIPDNLTDQWDSFQLLVDDVLRVQASETSYDMALILQQYIVDNSTDTMSYNAASAPPLASNFSVYPGGADPASIAGVLVQQPHYLRLAYYNSLTASLGDFTKAATVWFNGTFIEPVSGAT